MIRFCPPLAPLALLCACQPSGQEEARPFAGIGADEVVHFAGTEPFWGGQVAGPALRYTTAENGAGRTIAVDRFAGRGGVSWIGTLDAADFVIAVTPEACGDGMSARSYPYAALLKIGDERQRGCAWTDRQPFTGSDAP